MLIGTEGGTSLTLECKDGCVIALISAPKITITEGRRLPFTTASEASAGQASAAADRATTARAAVDD